jgi:hypothetical protein
MHGRTKNSIFKELQQGYDEYMANSQKLLDNILKFSIDDLNKLKELLNTTPVGTVLLDLVEGATKKKRDLIKSIKLGGKQIKQLIRAYRKHISSTNTTNT